MAYNKMARWVAVGVCVSYAIPLYSMNDELNDPIHERPRSSYTLLGINSEWCSRYCPSFLRSDRTTNRIPIIAPTQPSSIATVPSKYSRKQIAMMAGLTIGAGVMGYYVGSTCQMCTAELQNAQRYVGEMDTAFNKCTDTTTHLTDVVVNLTAQVVECVGSVDDLKDAIMEYCLPK